MPDPRSQLLSFPLDLGVDLVSDAEVVSPIGERPRLTQSLNTRLTTVPGKVTKSPAATSLASITRCGGVVPCGNADSKVAFAHPGDGGNQRIVESTVDRLTAWDSASLPQNSFFPAQVVRAGALPAGGSSFQTPAVCYDSSSGYTYYASYVEYIAGSSNSAIAITVMGDDGEIVCLPTVVLGFSTIARSGRFVAITCHGAGVVRLWYDSGSANELRMRAVTVSGMDIALGAPTALLTPSAVTLRSVAVASDPSDNSVAYLVSFTAAGTNARITRVNPVTMAVLGGIDVATGGDATTSHAIAYSLVGGTGRLALMASWFGGNCSLYELHATTLATVWSATNRMTFAREASCGFLRTPTLDLIVFACSHAGNVANSTNPGGTNFEFRNPSAGTLFAAADLPWHQLVGQIAQLQISSLQDYPLIPVQVVYDVTSRDNPSDVNFVTDPSIEIVTPQYDSSGLQFDWALRGRFGADTCIKYPPYNTSVGGSLGGCQSFVCNDGVARLAYLATIPLDGVAPDRPRQSRFVAMDFSPSQPPYALLSSGQAIVGGAMPMAWDGGELTELSPIRAPKIFGTATGGAGTNLTGTFLFAAVVSWTDGAGQIHRSPPSNIISLSPAGTPVVLYVTRPVTYKNGRSQSKFCVTIYASQAGGTVLYAQVVYGETVASSTSFWLHYTTISAPDLNAFTPALYTDGSATMIKANYCPSAFRDVAVIGDRVWTIYAELRSRAGYSQPMATEALAGIFPSFNPTQYIDFPASAGELLRVVNWRETPMFFTSSGVWTVDGEGPSALNDPPFFSAPRQLTDYPCTDARSVVVTPVGVMFRSRRRFVLMGAGGPVVSDDVAVSTDIAGVAVFRDHHEVVFVSATGAFVFNFKKLVWTVWDANTFEVAGVISSAIQDPHSDNLIYYSPEDAELFSMGPNSISSTAQITLQTGWIVPGGPQDDSRLENVVARCAKGGTHGVSLQIATDYQAFQTAKTYTSTDVDDMVQNGRYDLNPQPRDMPARAARLRLVETGATGEGMQPLNVTLELVRNVGKLAQSLRRTGRK